MIITDYLSISLFLFYSYISNINNITITLYSLWYFANKKLPKSCLWHLAFGILCLLFVENLQRKLKPATLPVTSLSTPVLSPPLLAFTPHSHPLNSHPLFHTHLFGQDLHVFKQYLDCCCESQPETLEILMVIKCGRVLQHLKRIRNLILAQSLAQFIASFSSINTDRI